METIADIVREMRKDIPRVVDAKVILRNYADRIEAAYKREIADALNTGAFVEATRKRETVTDCNGLNNAKMREALEQVFYIVRMYDDIDEVRRRVKMVNSSLDEAKGANYEK